METDSPIPTEIRLQPIEKQRHGYKAVPDMISPNACIITDDKYHEILYVFESDIYVQLISRDTYIDDSIYIEGIRIDDSKVTDIIRDLLTTD
jgi:hypothetical protein